MLFEIQRQDEELNRHRENLEAEVSGADRRLTRVGRELTRAKEAAEAASRLKSEFLANVVTSSALR
jgi:hypothetical protein